MDEMRRDAARGAELSRFLNSEPVGAALTIARAGIYDRWANSETVMAREEAHAEHKALERLMDAFNEIQNSGVLAQETLKAMDDELSDRL